MTRAIQLGWIALCALGAPGCRQIFGIDSPVLVDAAVDSPPVDMAPEPDAPACPGTSLGDGAYTVCLETTPGMPVTLGSTLDTSADSPLCLAKQPPGWLAAGQPESCFVVGTTITVPTVRVTGARPLVLVATDTITVGGTLDVASHVGDPAPGPGAPATTCAPFASVPSTSNGVGGGGAGASFMTAGGRGGSASFGTSARGTAPPADAMPPTVLRGGCDGQTGADGTTASSGGVGGRGGGAVYLLAGSAIELKVSSIINASGAGAGESTSGAGGGGGGSGGTIVLYAGTSLAVTSGARLLANGGGASGGATTAPGGAGGDPLPSQPTTPASGGMGGGSGNGGNGFAGNSAAGSGFNVGSPNNGGAGGGGGGGGYIQTNRTLAGATVSPAPTLAP